MNARNFIARAFYRDRQDPPSRELIVKLESQVHEMRFFPNYSAGSPYSPQQQMEMEVISALRGRAIDAYFLVLCEGLGAVAGRPVTPEQVGTTVDTVIEVAEKKIAGLTAANLAQKGDIDKLEAQIEALERTIARMARNQLQDEMRRAVEADNAAS